MHLILKSLEGQSVEHIAMQTASDPNHNRDPGHDPVTRNIYSLIQSPKSIHAENLSKAAHNF